MKRKRERDIQTDRKIDMQTDKKTGRQIDIQTDIKRGRQNETDRLKERETDRKIRRQFNKIQQNYCSLLFYRQMGIQHKYNFIENKFNQFDKYFSVRIRRNEKYKIFSEPKSKLKRVTFIIYSFTITWLQLLLPLNFIYNNSFILLY